MEEINKEEVCCGKGQHGQHHKCCGHKIIILVMAILVIFSLGICFGFHLNHNRYVNNRGLQKFEIMERGANFNMEKRGQMNKTGESVCGCQSGKEIQAAAKETADFTITTVSSPVKTINPVTPLK